MKIAKQAMRAAARRALEERGFDTKVEALRGVSPGARLIARKDADELKISVRTAANRRLGVTRNAKGRWKTLPIVDAVVVVAPAREQVGLFEIVWLDASKLLLAFDAELRRLGEAVEIAPNAPVFLPLDRQVRSGREAFSGLTSLAEWTVLVPMVPAEHAPAESSFVERVKREFAALIGVEVDKVAVEFRVLA